MPRGGARLGAGRPKKSGSRPKIRLLASGEAAVAYEFLTSAVQDPDLPFADRLKAAAVLLPFEKRRVRPLQPLGRKERAAEAAQEAAVGIYEPTAPPPQAEQADRAVFEPPRPPKGFRN
jgi:hypothetical protein